jgi:UDP-N-acetylglucosamine acyltransferase
VQKEMLDLIHPTAIIDPKANIAANVRVGAYSTIAANVEIGEGCVIGSHVVINGTTIIGKNNQFFQFSSIGEDPQDKKYNGEDTLLQIGDNNVIREFVTLNRGTVQGGGKTVIGNDNLIMAYVHVAHDCYIGNHTIFANNVSLAGHVTIQDYVILGGFSLVHQFCTLGSYCFTAFSSGIAKDIPPYVMVSGYKAKPHGLNIEGLKRNNFSEQTIKLLKESYTILYRSNLTVEKAISKLITLSTESAEVTTFVDFLQHNISRGVIR